MHNTKAEVISFHSNLIETHLEEASFLYEQRLSLIDDPELTWLDVHDFEERFEPHIDGLYLGEELALAVCKQQATEGDFGELHAAIRVFCRHDKLDLATEIIEAIDVEDEERVQAVRDALAYELPDTWLIPLMMKYRDVGGIYEQVLPYALGFQRRMATDTLLPKLDSEHKADILWALGRLRDNKVIQVLQHFHTLAPDEQREASLALMRVGYLQVVGMVEKLMHTHPWALSHVGLCGGASQVKRIQQVMVEQGPSTEGVLALGLLGDPAVVPFLIQHLDHAEVAEAASLSLYLMTGEAIMEEVFIPEEIDEDELFEEELEKLRNGEPLFELGEEPGTTLNRISQDAVKWTAWWEQHQGRFAAGVRCRHGMPHAPASVLESLKAEETPNTLRRLLYEELVVRYALDVPFEVEMTVREQLKAISQYETLVQENATAFTPGKWYFAGRLVG